MRVILADSLNFTWQWWEKSDWSGYKELGMFPLMAVGFVLAIT